MPTQQYHPVPAAITNETSRVFQDMLNEFLPNSLLREEMIKRDYFLKNVKKDNSWSGGNLVVPFKGATASSVRLGKLTASNDIAQSKFIRGTVAGQPEAWGSLIFNERDLMEHGKISEQNLLKILPQEISDHMDFFKNIVSLGFTNGPRLAKVTDATNAATGIMIVDRPERLAIDQKLVLDDGDSAATSVYVTAIDMNTGAVTLSASRGGVAANLAAYSVAQSAALYVDGYLTTSASDPRPFSSLRTGLLPAAQGGSDSLYGVTKTSYPYLQPIINSGASIDASNILSKIFEHQTLMRNRSAGMANKVIMSYKHWGSIMKILQQEKGPFRQADAAKASQYGWDEVTVVGVRGKLDLVAIQEIDDDFMPFLDLDAFTIYSNGFFKKRVSPDGLEYFPVREETGFKYIIDTCFFGDMILEKPSRCGCLYGISY